MNTFRLIADSPLLQLGAKGTALLALAWCLHGALRNRHPRWRTTVWRSSLVFGWLLVPASFSGLPGFRFVLPPAAESARVEVPARDPEGMASDVPAPTNDAVTPPASVAVGDSLEARPPIASTHLAPRRGKADFPWANPAWVLGGIWALGLGAGVFALLRQNRRLGRILDRSRPAPPELQARAEAILSGWGTRRRVEVRVSEEIRSPFVCRPGRPRVVIPESLVAGLDETEAMALLGHEIAHLRRGDLFWNLAWRWTAVVGWIHPLLWKAPAAHGLACELEADRQSAGLQPSREDYAGSLARLTLRTVGWVPGVSAVTLNGTSDIIRRLTFLARRRAPEWRSRDAMASLLAGALVFGLLAGCGFRDADDPNAPVEYGYVEVQVVDEDDQPIEGAEVIPFGYRVAGHDSASAYGWHGPRFGSRAAVPTDAGGKARIRYPIVAVPEEKLRTGQLLLVVEHARYAQGESQGFPVEGRAEPIRLRRGVTVRVSGYHGPERTPVDPLVPCLGGDDVPRDGWIPEGNGVMAFHRFSPGERLVQFMGRLPSGEVVYSESLAFVAEQGREHRFELEMKPGIRIEGRLDDRVPRPIREGRVLISVRPKELPATTVPEEIGDVMSRYGYFHPWHSYRPIAEDGTFVFESVPAGGLDVICLGQGFASVNGGTARNRLPDGRVVDSPPIGVPQAFELQAPLTRITVVTEPTATLRVMARTRQGTPVAGVRIAVSPNLIRLPGGIFGDAMPSCELPFRELEPLPTLPYRTETDHEGVAVLSNLPACARGLDCEHPDLVPALDPERKDRWVRFRLTPGGTSEVSVALVPRGADPRGAEPR